MNLQDNENGVIYIEFNMIMGDAIESIVDHVNNYQISVVKLPTE